MGQSLFASRRGIPPQMQLRSPKLCKAALFCGRAGLAHTIYCVPTGGADKINIYPCVRASFAKKARCLLSARTHTRAAILLCSVDSAREREYFVFINMAVYPLTWSVSSTRRASERGVSARRPPRARRSPVPSPIVHTTGLYGVERKFALARGPKPCF